MDQTRSALSSVRALVSHWIFPQNFLFLGVICWMSLSAPKVVVVVEASKAYPLGCSKEDSTYYDYDKYPFPPPNVPTKSTDDYFLVERLGTGKFSDVFSAVEADQVKLDQRHGILEIDPKSLLVIKVHYLLFSLLGMDWWIKCLMHVPLPTCHVQSGKSVLNQVGNPRLVSFGFPWTPQPTSLLANLLGIIFTKKQSPVTGRKIRRELLILSHVSKMPNHSRLLVRYIVTFIFFELPIFCC